MENEKNWSKNMTESFRCSDDLQTISQSGRRIVEFLLPHFKAIMWSYCGTEEWEKKLEMYLEEIVKEVEEKFLYSENFM